LIQPRIETALAASLSLMLFATAGCGKASSLAEVSGTVTLNGKPLPGVLVTFYPIAEKGDQPLAMSFGTSDDNGKFTLTCQDNRPGAFVGKHRVTVTWPPKDRSPPPANRPVLPVAVMAIGHTPLQKDVTAGQNTIPVEVTSQ
jgi:hypothetical protein